MNNYKNEHKYEDDYADNEHDGNDDDADDDASRTAIAWSQMRIEYIEFENPFGNGAGGIFFCPITTSKTLKVKIKNHENIEY